MAGSFMQTAVKQVVDVTSFLKDAANGNGIKYSAESGKQHRILVIPCTREVEVEGVKTVQTTINAIEGKVHDWRDSSGRYASTICLEGVVRQAEDGTILNDGSCPFCKRVADAWDIYNYRYQQEEETCQLQGDYRKKHLENCKTNFADERKAKAAAPYIYLLIAQFKVTDDGQPIITEGTQLPAYDIKVMKLSAKRLEKMQKQCTNSGIDIVGSELLIDYAVNDDIRQVVGQSTITPVVIDSAKFTARYPAVLEQIEKDAAKFDWDGIMGAFPEWKGMTSMEANNTITEMFHKWDEYQQEKLINPMAKYMEYAYQLQTQNPNLTPQVPSLNGVITPNIPQSNPAVPPITGMGNISAPPIPGMSQAGQSVPSVPPIPGMSQAGQSVPSVPPIPGMTQANNTAQASNATQPEVPGMTSKPAHDNSSNPQIPGMPSQNTGQNIPGMPSQPTEQSSNNGVAFTANQLLGGGPSFVV